MNEWDKIGGSFYREDPGIDRRPVVERQVGKRDIEVMIDERSREFNEMVEYEVERMKGGQR